MQTAMQITQKNITQSAITHTIYPYAHLKIKANQ